MITVYGYGFEVPKPPPPPTPWGTYLLAAAAAWWAWTKWGKGGRARVSNPRRRRHAVATRRRRNPSALRGGSAVYEDRPNGMRWPVAYGSRAEMEAMIRRLRKIYPRKKFSLSTSLRGVK